VQSINSATATAVVTILFHKSAFGWFTGFRQHPGVTTNVALNGCTGLGNKNLEIINFYGKRRVFCLEPVQKQPKYDSQYEPSGLVNLGNSCFVNAIVQAIFAVPLFQDKFLHGVHTNEYSFSNELQSLFTRTRENPIVNPSQLVEMVPNMSTHPFYIRNPAKVSERTQEDAHELFGLLIENIEREHFLIKNLSFKVNSVISCCGKNCNHQVDKNLTETNLSLPITKSDLGAIIDDYLSDEIINDSTCDTCNKEHLKRTFVPNDLPEVLCIHLKRFKRTYNKYSQTEETEKITTDVEIPLKLQGNFGTEFRHFYELESFLSHRGRAWELGHYVAFGKHAGNWIKMDDRSLKAQTNREIDL